ncbi:MAG TPA: VOC family protein [Bryobacteraceae bacterium]|jgi:lactoylglutathione lyase|nr:VOC family protein [Bryobacteraceae bacterium]
MRRATLAFTFGAAAVAACFLLQGRTTAQTQASVERPRIIGLAHVGLFVSDIAKADEFYGHVLGCAHFSLDKPSGGLMLNYYKVNDHQYIEIYPGLKDDQDRLSHIAFETSDARKMRAYLASKGVKVPQSLKPGLDKNLSFMVSDPEGRRIEFVQYMPGSLHSSKFGTLLPDTRISDHMIHAGFVVHDRAAEDKFYKDILGFTVMWYGGMKDNEINWVDMRVPDGSDWIEYMLNVTNPSAKTRGVMNHFALGVKNIHTVYNTILSRVSTPPAKPKIGRDGKWQLNLYDPDLTRAELMEFKPVETPCCSPMNTR